VDDDHNVSGVPTGTCAEGRANALDGRPCVLLAEHDAGIGRLHYTNLAQVGFDVVAVNSGQAVLEACARYKNLAVAILDFDLPDLNGLQALSRIRNECKQASTIVTTSKGSLTSAVNVMRAGAFDYLIKPISPERLVAAVCAAAQKQTHAKSVERLPADDDVRILGSSAVMADVSRIIRSAASSKAAVFITGESGTGKEVCAELIHLGSERAKKPFIAFNCSALPRDLIESEIFGHVKGAFTGAVHDRPGAAILAHGGTLFLDEICEMDLSLQAKLLRFLQNGKVRRLGASNEEQVDVRIICATNRNPLNELRAGRFREDLYYRLHVIPISLPPLRDRGNDTIELARAFLEQYSAEEGKHFKRFSACAEAALASYSWPGNIRQLQNMIRNAVVFSDGEELTAAAFPELVHPRLSTPACFSAVVPFVEPPPIHEHSLPSGDRRESLAQIERDAIERSMRLYDNNIARAAAALGISPSTIYRKLQAWNKTTKDRSETV
jgi:two-component system, repressor protein LuxO